MKAIILPDLAMVCIHLGCSVIFEGQENRCPICGWDAVSYREIEALASGIPLMLNQANSQPSTETIQ